ncbi:MAG TPA: protein translocase subunit SecD [Deltaproteobacteria bacterium]|nr:protein translocase subunit SecD [Deltaproteobacteria bacterium]
MKSIFWRLVLLGTFSVLALALFLPSTKYARYLPDFWVDYIPKITLGLDLQGGMHLVLDVDQEKAVENYTARLAGSMEAELKKKGLRQVTVKLEGNDTVVVTYKDDGDRGRINQLVAERFPQFDRPAESPGRLAFSLMDAEARRIKEWASSQALETIRNRIDRFGVREPVIQRQGTRQIVVQLPGLRDPERAIKLIGKTAVLEFKLLDEEHDVYEALEKGPPPGTEILYKRARDPASGRVVEEPYLVKKETLLTGDTLSDARVQIDTQFNEPYVSLTFDSTGSRIFERITARNVGKRLAIILDGNVHSAPQIRERIAGGRAQISGGFTHEEATDLAIVLRAGALPAPVTIIQNVTVGPTLGHDSIEAGIRAVTIGGLLVLVFMVLYYRVAGVIADVAVMLNIIMLLGAMACFNATLTLPGIAGIILTIGMGVDSNVLIFERIKEELRAGRTPRSAVDAGYDHAWWTIVDSHVTTLITAAVLYQYGSGPIKGFAVTLGLGILINLFTALVGTKVALDIQNDKLRVSRLSI